MDADRRQLNAIRQELSAVTPEHCTDSLPPQPSIVPGLGEPVLVRYAHKVNNLANRHPQVKQALRTMYHGVKRYRTIAWATQQIGQISFSEQAVVKVSIVIPVFNKFELTIQCLRSIYTAVPASGSYEVIIVDNGSSDATTRLARLKGLRYLRVSKNLGFVGGCNYGASKAAGEYVIFLNNDTMVTEGWLENLVETIETYPKAGIVGSKLIYPDGKLQEAGGIIFKDGTGSNYGRNDHPDRYQYNYLREVDYCSGASIIIKRSLFDELQGFDTIYQPAYYEDTDLAFRVRKSGYKVIYQPLSAVYHFEGATSGNDTSTGFKKYQLINHRKFMKRWGKLLRSEQYTPDEVYPARDRTHKKLFLIVDEHVPTPDQDSGSVRLVAIIKLLQETGYKVTLFPNYTKHRGKYTQNLAQAGVEVVYGDIRFEDFIRQFGKYYDGVMLSRPRIGSYYMDLCQAYCAQAKILYDTVDLHYLRLKRQADYEVGTLQQYYHDMSEKHEKLEHYLIKQADTAIVVSEFEQRLLQQAGYNNVSVLSNIHTIRPGAYAIGFENRRDIIFVGGFRHLPNIDAVRWFADEIFPKIVKQDKKIRFHVAGSEMPDFLISHLQQNPNIIVHGFVEDLSELLTQSRVFVAPMRFGAGVKGKIGQAIEYGLPVITTSIGAEGMHLEHDISCIAADTANDFAKGVLKLYSNSSLWLKLQKQAAKVVDDYFSVQQARQSLKQILNN